MANLSSLNTTAEGSRYRDKALAILGTKGGVGKTTANANFADALARFGLRVLICDLDANAGVSSLLDANDGTNQRSIAQLLQVPDTVTHDDFSRVAVRPADWQPTAELPWWRGGQLLPGGLIDILPAPDNGLATIIEQRGQEAERKLFDVLTNSEISDEYDVILVDAAGNEGGAFYMALYACRNVLWPLKPEDLDLRGWTRTIQLTIKFAGNNQSYPIEAIGAFLSLVGRFREHSDTIELADEWLTENYGEGIPLLRPPIVHRTVVPASSSRKIPASRYTRNVSNLDQIKDAAATAAYSRVALNIVAKVAPEKFDGILDAFEQLTEDELPERVSQVMLSSLLQDPAVGELAEDPPKKR